MNLTQGIGSPSTIGILRGGFRSPLQLLLGHTPTTQLRAPKFVLKLHNRSLRGTSKPSRVHDAPKRQQALGNTMHPRVTSFSTSIFTYHRRESNPMQQMQAARTHKVVKSFTLKFQPSNKCFGGNKRGRTRGRTTKELQELDPLGSPHLEEILIGGMVDLDLLS